MSLFESLLPLPSYTERVQVSLGKDNVFSCVPEQRRKSPLQICFRMKTILETMRVDTEEHHHLHCPASVLKYREFLSMY